MPTSVKHRKISGNTFRDKWLFRCLIIFFAGFIMVYISSGGYFDTLIRNFEKSGKITQRKQGTDKETKEEKEEKEEKEKEEREEFRHMEFMSNFESLNAMNHAKIQRPPYQNPITEPVHTEIPTPPPELVSIT